MKIKTTILQNMVSKVIKGASSNKLIPITNLMCIEYKLGTLTLITTDSNNYLYVREKECGEGDYLYAVIPVDQFSRLVSRTTSEYITLEVSADNSIFKVGGNGKYTISIPLDEEGNAIKYPNPITEDIAVVEPNYIVNLSILKLILQVCKPALATTLEVPVYTNYYIGNKIVTTDTYKICGINKELFEGKKFLIAPECMNLFDTFTDEIIAVYIYNDNYIVFNSPHATIYSILPDGVDEYAIDAINGLLEQEFLSRCSIDKAVLISILDRISIFVGDYDNKAIRLIFDNSSLIIESKQSNGIEKIDYSNSENFKPFTCMIDINMFSQQVKAYAGDVIELYFGEDNAIKFVDGNVTQVIALLEE